MSAATRDIGRLLETRAGFHGGRPCVRGTGVTVHTIAAHHLQGVTAEGIHDGFPQASLAAIHAALAYFYCHREEIEADLASDANWASDAARRLHAETV